MKLLRRYAWKARHLVHLGVDGSWDALCGAQLGNLAYSREMPECALCAKKAEEGECQQTDSDQNLSSKEAPGLVA